MSNSIKTTSNTQQAFWIALGSLFSFGFGLISSVILSRYFPKTDYGTYKQVLYVYSTLLTVFTLGLPKTFSFFLPRVEVEQARSLISKITLLFFLLGGVFSIILFVASDKIAAVLNNPDLGLALRIFSPVPFLMLPTMGLEGILSTFRMTKFMAVYTITTRLGMLLCVALPVILFSGNYNQAIIGFVIGSFISFVLALYFKYYPVRNRGREQTTITYRQIFKFSLPLLTASLWGMLIKSTDQFFISRYFGTEVFAEFSNGIMNLPFMGMIVGATATVLSPVFSKMSHDNINPKEDIYPLWMSTFEKSALLIYPLLLFTMVFAELIMVTLYGQQYKNSAIYYQIHNVTNFFQIIVYAPLIINIGKVRFYQNVHMYSALILIPLEYLIILLLNSPYMVVSVSVLMSITRSLILLDFVSKFFRVKYFDLFPLQLIYKIVFPSLGILFLEYYLFIKILQLNEIVTLIFAFITYIFLYTLYSYSIGLNYASIVKPLIYSMKINKN